MYYNELNALRADFKNLQYNKGSHRSSIPIQACGVLILARVETNLQ